MEPKEVKFKKLTEKGITALLIFFVESLESTENNAIEVSFYKRRGDEVLAHDIDGNPAYVYPEGVYLLLGVKGGTLTAKDFKKIKPFLGSYIVTRRGRWTDYELRLTDKADDDITNVITPEFLFGDKPKD